MKKYFIISSLVLICQLAKAQVKSDDIIGDWITTDKNAIIRCFKQGNLYYGKVLWYAPFIAEEEGHPIDPADNTRFLNTICMKNFLFDKNEWSGGQIIDGYHNKKYSAFAQINKKKQLEVTGFILFRCLSQTMKLDKANPQIVEQYMNSLLTKH